MNIEQLIQYGAMGVVLLWFMYRNEKQLSNLNKTLNNHIATAINNNAKALLLLMDVISKCPSNNNGKNIRQKEIDNLKEEISQSNQIGD